MSEIRTEFRLSFIQETLNDIFYNRTNFFYYIGRIVPWANDSIADPAPSTTNTNDVSIRNHMVYMRKIKGRDVSLVVPNYTWTSGQVYRPWDDTLDMRSLPFYVMTVNGDVCKVYKCLDNAGGAPSVNEPTSTGVFTTADGYRWIFMYDIPVLKQRKFVSRGFIPVQRALSDSFYNRGAIESVTIANTGDNYASASLTVSGDGTGAILAPTIVDGKITNVTITNPGINYTFARITITGTPEVGTVIDPAEITANIAESDFTSNQASVEQAASTTVGRIYCIKVTNPGSGYTNAPQVTITGNGSGATATAVVDNGQIDRIIVTSPGTSPYTIATVTITDPQGTGATARAILPPMKGHGFDAVRELFGETLSLYSLIQDDDQLNALNQDYRQYGLIVNPTDILTNRLITTDANFLTFDVQFNNIGTMAVDDVLISATGKQYCVVSIAGAVAKLIQMDPIFEIPSGNMVRQVGQITSTFTIASILSVPTVNKYSGYLLTVSNETPFSPSLTSAIATRTFLKI